MTAAVDAGQAQAQVDALQAKADVITAQRNTLFRGETLRGLLLSAYAWSTVGSIAGIAAIGAFVAAGLMAILVVSAWSTPPQPQDRLTPGAHADRPSREAGPVDRESPDIGPSRAL